MTRPTPGREAPSPASGPARTFPATLAAVLNRSATGGDVTGGCAAGRAAPSAQARPVPAGPVPVGSVPAAPPVPAGPVAPGDRSPVGPRMVVVADGGPDTPEPDPGHLIEVVGPEAAPLWRRFLRRRDRPARERLIEHYGPLVRGVGAKLAIRLPSTIELADLVQSGTFGLMEAVDRFDPARAVRFDGYAAQRVRGAMLDELRAQDWVPRTVRARSREVERARETVAVRTGRTPTDRELAAELGVGLRELRHAVRPVHLVSAELLGQAGGAGGHGVADLLVDDVTPDPVQVAARRETSRELRAAVAELGERDRLVLRLYYLENRTLAEIGVVLGVTESRVCQLHSRTVTRLRGRMEPLLAG